MMLIAHLRLGFLLATVVASLHVAAAPRFWTLTGVQFEDGAVATGYVSYDATTGTIVNWNLRVSGGAGSFVPYIYYPGNSAGPYYAPAAAQNLNISTLEGDGGTWRSFQIYLLAPLDGSSATVPINVAASYDSFESYFRTLEARRITAGALVLTTSPIPAQAIDINQHGLTGSWHTPWVNGQGVALEVYQDAIAPGVGYLHGGFAAHAVGSETGQRWYTFGGSVRTGQAIATLGIFQNTGGNFNAPPTTQSLPIGTMLLTFVDCDTATLEYRDLLLDIERPYIGWSPYLEATTLVRLTPNVTCSVDGASAQNVDFSYSGHWFNSGTPGQGLFVELNPIAEASFAVWYTYARDGESRGAEGQRWYTGQGHFVPGARTLPMTLYETTGYETTEGRYGRGYLDFITGTQPVGAATVAFPSCNAATLTFSFTGGTNAGAAGRFNLSRVGPPPADCLP